MLHLSASDRVRPLAAALAEILLEPLDDPMQPEWVAIPTVGTRRWLELELARSLGASGPGAGDGVAANITFRFPGALRQAVLAADREDDRTDPWRVEHLVWAVLEVLDAGRTDDRLGPLTTLPPGATWFGRARRLADLFDRYAVHRPEMLLRWQEHRDVDTGGALLADHDRWQPHLWRLTRELIAEPSPPERFPALLDALRAGTLALELPDRLSVFGVTTLPGGAPFLELARAFAEHRELHLFLLDPSPVAVARVREVARAAPAGPGLLRVEDHSTNAVRHPLLRSWGRPYRERTVLLAEAEADGISMPNRVGDLPAGDAAPAPTLLARIQADLRADTVPAGSFELAADDRSIQVHSCHGPARQVEVLRDAILHLLADDPTLREEDIVVLSPTIEQFVPWIESGFGTPADRAPGFGESPWPRLAYRITDRSLRESAPLLAALDALLALVAGRFTASAVLELLALGPVRERFGFDDDAIAVISHWITETNVRWGLDGVHREAWGVPATYRANSWQAALDRLLMGVAVSEDDRALAPGEIAPFGVEGSDITVVGRLADALAHLGQIADDVERPRTAAAWCSTLLEASERLFAVDRSEERQLDQLRQMIAKIGEDASIGSRRCEVDLTLADVRRLLAERLLGAPRRPDFFRGGITFSSLTPLRWLPFRVVCLLGFDEAAMVAGTVDGDDLATRAPRLGDPDPRAELRQTLLEAVLAVEDHLVITRTGHNILTNHDVPEAVALAELRDTITATLAGDARDTFTARIETVHPHQPFDDRCFRPGDLRPGPWSFDQTALEGAEARARRKQGASPFLTGPLADPVGGIPLSGGPVVTVAELQAFLKHPVKAFFRRLQVHLPREEGELSDHLPISISGLDEWSAAHRLLEARLDGRTNEQWARHEQALGTLPAGGYGDAALKEITTMADRLLATAAELQVDPRHDDARPVSVELPDGTHVVGTVDLHCHGGLPGPAQLTYSKAQPKHHLEAWLDLIALVAQEPEVSWRSVMVRRNASGSNASALELVPRGATPEQRQAGALTALAVVVDCYRRGLREPIPLFAKLSRKLFDREAGAGNWISQSWGEGTEDSHVLAFGGCTLRELRAIPARADDPPGARPGRADRFADYLWGAVEASAQVRPPDETDEPDETDAAPDATVPAVAKAPAMTPTTRFDLRGPLPTGRVAIEASAGTGKTYTLAGLAVRYVAERGVPVSELLVVTFTRAAAAELRARVRTRLTEAARALRNPHSLPADDAVLHLLASSDADGRADRLDAAVTDFDAATITTIHGFAQQVLMTLGSAAPGDLDADLVDDARELVAQVCSDVLATAAVHEPAAVADLPKHLRLSQLVLAVLGNPGIAIVPEPDANPSAPVGARWRCLVDQAVDEVHRRRRAAGTMSFDDVLTQLRDALSRSPAAAAALRRRYRVALIDEFQDTDPVQWEIFSTVFGKPGDGSDTTLVLVGDPKQAIYAFRGANVHTYLQAAYEPGTDRSTLGTNWRSDQALLDALERLLAGATFGDPRIGFVDINAAPEHGDRRLLGPGGTALPALQVRAAVGDDLPRGKTGDPPPMKVDEAASAIARDLAREVQRLLEGACVPSADGSDPSGSEPVRPHDIAVLVTTHADAATMQTALVRAGIPAVAHRGGSVLDSPAAVQWRWLLTALARPSRADRARTAALSWFVGWSAARVDTATDDELAGVQEQLYRWAETLEQRGAVDFCAQVWAESKVTERVLATAEGDRNLTDLEHLAQLLRASASGHQPGPVGLLAALELLEEAHKIDVENDVTARRIESEAEAVQVMTVYAAKGLEFPVVCVPTLWRNNFKSRERIYQDPESRHRTLDVTKAIGKGGEWPTKEADDARKSLAEHEAVGENLRLLYVALTRARHQTIVWWSRALDSDATGLARVLFARDDDGNLDPDRFALDKVPMPPDSEAISRLEPIFAPVGDAVTLTETGLADGPHPPWAPIDPAPHTPTLELAVLGRDLERPHRRWSFSAISDRAANLDLDPGDDRLDDPGASDEPTGPEADDAVGVVSDLPLGAVPGGASFGTMVHDLLEHVDFAAPDLAADLQARIDERRGWSPSPVLGPELLAGLHAAIESPLGPLFDGRRLRDLSRADRLDELTFELRLGEAGRPATDRDIGELVARHLAADDPLRPWSERLAAGLFDVELGGHLTGSIDAVFRVTDPTELFAAPRYVLVDYKTNLLAERGRLPQSADYHPDRLPAAMEDHHYPLQALLYSVALHRYLRWRERDYDPGTHLGGAAYLFLRGMTGADTPIVDGRPHGVFAWRVPPALVTDLSDLLDGQLVRA